MTMIAKTFLILSAAVLMLVVTTISSPLMVINALTSDASYIKTEDIAYGADARQKLDVYVPRGRQGGAPVVVFFYGGNWSSGKRQDYKFVGEALASRGIVAVIADYRLYPQVRYPAFVEDGAEAVAWSLNHVQDFGGDPKRLYLMGHSAGAYNAAMLALDRRWLAAYQQTPSALRGWIGLAGPYDFIPIKNEATRPIFFYPDTPVDSQPINHITPAAPPALLIASATDNLVNPVRNTGGLSKQLRASGVGVTEMYFDSTNHENLIGTMAWPLRGLAPVLDQVEHFVKSDGGRAMAINR
ncbi:MAG TPA: alpha/beta hydrolase [Burkholderiaceae bacterium]|jgi:acetyl esterase/lipase